MSGTKIEGALHKVADAVTASADKTTSMADQIAAASDRAATVAEKAVETSGAMGIKGMFQNNLGNIAAMTIIAGAFIYLQREQVTQAKDDRVLFRETIATINASADKRYEKSEAVHGKAMEKLGVSIDKLVTATEANQKEVKEAAKDMKEAAQAIVRLSNKQPSPP